MALAVALAACSAEEEPGPRFANDPVEPVATTLVGSPGGEVGGNSALPATSPIATPAATPIDPAALLRSRGAPSRVYFLSGSELWTIDAEGTAPDRVYRAAPGETIASVAASPDGDRAALLTTGDDPNDPAGVVVVDADARVVVPRRPIPRGQTGTDGSAVGTLDWSPQGDRLLVSAASAGLIALPAGGGDAEVVVPVSASIAPGYAAWSPTGEEIAFLAPAGAEQPTDLFLVRTDPAPSTPGALEEAALPGQGVGDVAWTPDGRHVLFTLGVASGGAVGAADLWRIATDGSGRRVVVSAGSAVPVGRIGRVAPAPDGEAVAYTVSVPGEEGQRFHSLWVKPLGAGGGPAVQLGVPAGESVVELWWTEAGVVFRTETDPGVAEGAAGNDVKLYRASAEGTPMLMFEKDGGPASPEAAPAASPRSATPAGAPSSGRLG